jgi:hypothetical protein
LFDPEDVRLERRTDPWRGLKSYLDRRHFP